MTRGRLVLLLTGILVFALAVLFVLLGWEMASRLATAVGALAGVAGIGVAIWASCPTVPRRGVRVSRTGRATAGASGAANTGFSGGMVLDDVRVYRTGDAEGGHANTGVERR